MLKRLFKNLARRERWLWLAPLAVLAPVMILLWLQYRALLDLRGKTRVALEYNLRQTLQELNRATEKRLAEYARATLWQLNDEDMTAGRWDAVRRAFDDLRHRQPEIHQLYLASDLTPNGDEHFLWWDGQSWQARVVPGDADEEPALAAGSPEANWAAALNSSLAAQPQPGQPVELSFGRADGGDELYVFRLVQAQGERACVIGLSLRAAHLRETLLPPLFAQAWQTADEEARQAGLTLAALKTDQQVFYATSAGAPRWEISVPFAPAFPGWRLAAALGASDLEQLAQRYHRQSLWLNGLALLVLLGGLALAWRVFHREMRLAQAKAAFVSNVSHELKTPLALIRLFAETLLLERVRSPAKAREYHRIIVHETDRLTQLINNILDFSAIEAGRREYHFAPCDLAELVREVLHSYEFVLHKAGFTCETALAADLPPLNADRAALAQALLNLLNNAVKYSRDERYLKISLLQTDTQLALVVEDRGIGIPRGEQQRIFEKFYRAGDPLVHETKGTGLGLALVQHIVQAHGGAVEVASTPGQGSCFTLRFPLERAP